MTRDEFKKWKRHDYLTRTGINDGSGTPELKGHFWFLTVDEKTGATIVKHAKKLEDL